MATATAVECHVQHQVATDHTPSNAQFQQWLEAALANFCDTADITIRVVGASESATLNQSYRKKTGPTNILSFQDPTPQQPNELAGDLVICADLVKQEAEHDKITVTNHWAHLVIHGCYHLLGYDHQTDSDALVMQALEIKALAKLNIANPYLDEEYHD